MRSVSIFRDNIYHVYNRGVNRQNIFFQQANWVHFLSLTKKYFTPELVDVIAYCLMPNHFHFLLKVMCDDFGKKSMMPFLVSYTKSINLQENRVGSLFQGAYQAKVVDSDESVLHLSRYIHLNPLHAGLVDKAEQWMFSSYQDYLGIRKGSIPKTDLVLSFFPSVSEYQRFVEEDQIYSIDGFIFKE